MCDMYIIADIKTEALGFPVVCYLVAREFTLSSQHLIFFNLFTLFTYIKKILNLTDILRCRTVALHSTQRIVFTYIWIAAHTMRNSTLRPVHDGFQSF